MTPYLSQGIERIGYAPFYFMGKYDHRLLYVDIRWDHIFRHKADATQARGQQLSVKNRRVTKMYLKTLKSLENKSGIHRGMKKIRQRMTKDDQTNEDRAYCINKMKQYKTTMIQLMISANRTATKKKPSIFKWSSTLRKNGK